MLEHAAATVTTDNEAVPTLCIRNLDVGCPTDTSCTLLLTLIMIITAEAHTMSFVARPVVGRRKAYLVDSVLVETTASCTLAQLASHNSAILQPLAEAGEDQSSSEKLAHGFQKELRVDAPRSFFCPALLSRASFKVIESQERESGEQIFDWL